MHTMLFCSNVPLRAPARAARLILRLHSSGTVGRKQLAENNGQGWVMLSHYKNKQTSVVQTKNATTPSKNAWGKEVTTKRLDGQSVLNAARYGKAASPSAELALAARSDPHPPGDHLDSQSCWIDRDTHPHNAFGKPIQKPFTVKYIYMY